MAKALRPRRRSLRPRINPRRQLLWVLAAVGALALGYILGVWEHQRQRPPEASQLLAPGEAAKQVVTPHPVPGPRPPDSMAAYEEKLPAETYEAPGVRITTVTQPGGPPLPPHPAPSADGLPAWLAAAVSPPPVDGRPMIALVIDDMGLDRHRSAQIVALPGPLTISFMTYAAELPKQAAAARARGHELMVHVPMEPGSRTVDPGPEPLLVSLEADEIRRRLAHGLTAFDGYVGINNHMGSRFSAYAPGMRVVLEEIKRRGLLFLDSRTTQHPAGPAIARELGVPLAERNVFLDHDNDPRSVAKQIAEMEQFARRNGFVVAIGHPRDATIQALRAWLPRAAGKGFALVPLSTIVRYLRAAG